MHFREELTGLDINAVREAGDSTGFFTPDEVALRSSSSKMLLKEDPARGTISSCWSPMAGGGVRLLGLIPAYGHELRFVLDRRRPGRARQGPWGAAVVRGGRPNPETRRPQSLHRNLISRSICSNALLLLRCGYLETRFSRIFYRDGDSKVIYSKVLS